MKKEITQEVTLCDDCEKIANCGQLCDTCGKDFCWTCQSKRLVHYSDGVFYSSDNEGSYCIECDEIHRKSGTDDKWNSYQVILSLRKEINSFRVDFNDRAKVAELLVKKLGLK